MISCVFSFVWVIAQLTWLALTFVERNENRTGSASPGCFSNLSQLIERLSRRGGVPVFNRDNFKPKLSILSASFTEGSSPILPPGRATSPIWITPRRNVPVVSTTDAAVISLPSRSLTPDTFFELPSRSTTSPKTTSKFSCLAISFWMAFRYNTLSDCALGP